MQDIGCTPYGEVALADRLAELLYAYPVFCEVQRLYSSGRKLRQPSLPVAGELTLHKWRGGSNNSAMRLRADFIGPDREPAVPVLIDAVVIKITEAGVVLIGTELVPRNSSSKSNVERYPQTWWCRLLPGKMVILVEPPQELPNWRLAFQHPVE